MPFTGLIFVPTLRSTHVQTPHPKEEARKTRNPHAALALCGSGSDALAPIAVVAVFATCEGKEQTQEGSQGHHEDQGLMEL